MEVLKRGQSKNATRLAGNIPLAGKKDPGYVPAFTVTGTLCPSPRLASRTMGFRSLIVTHTVHLNTFNSFGHRTIESHVMHFPVRKSLSGTFCFPPDLFVVVLLGEPESLSVDSNPPAAPGSPLRFFFPVKIEGNGWLIDRPWPGGRDGLEEAAAP
jgi:hypothetical protein